MMSHALALRISLDLVHMPSRARLLRRAPLPDDVVVLLQILAGQEEALPAASESTGRPADLLLESAAFFVEQVMLHPDADSYQVLGAHPHATNSELRRNMALLLTWLHPDLARQKDRAVLAQRVTTAWEDVKTPERRALYDKAALDLREKKVRSRRRRHAAGKRPMTPRPERTPSPGNAAGIYRDEGEGLLRRGWAILIAGAKRRHRRTNVRG